MSHAPKRSHRPSLRSRRPALLGAALAASLTLVASACGSSSNQATSTSSASAAAATEGSAATAGTGAATTTAAATGGGPADKVLRLSFLQDPGQPPDPDVFYAGQGLALTLNAYEGLLTYKLGTATPTIVGQLATAWKVSPDKSTYTLTLRHGVTFHDGTAFDASAVKASFDRRMAVNQGPAYMVSDVVSVTSPSPYQVVIKLKGPNSAFLDYLAAPYGPKMMSPTGLAKYAGKDHDQTYLHDHDLGTGAYTITEAKVGQQYTLKAYDGWWGGKVYFSTIDLPVVGDISTQQLEFQKGQLAAILHDLNAPAVKSMLADTKIATYVLPTFTNQELFINPASGFMASKANRNAFQAALDIPALVNSVFKGRGTVPDSIYARGLLPAGMGAQNITFDSSKLKAAVAAAPASERTIVLGYDTSMPDDQQLANLVSATFAGYGLTIKVQGFTTSQNLRLAQRSEGLAGRTVRHLLAGRSSPLHHGPHHLGPRRWGQPAALLGPRHHRTAAQGAGLGLGRRVLDPGHRSRGHRLLDQRRAAERLHGGPEMAEGGG